MVVLLWAGAAGVDLGFSVWGSRSAQAEADTAALDLSKYLDIADAQVSQTSTKSYLDGIIDKIETDNGYGSSTTITETPGKWSNGTWSVPVACSSTTPPNPLGCNAVKVTATQKVPQIFYGGFNNLSARTAIAADTPEAGFSIGTFLANINASQSPLLNPLLGSIGSANVTLVGYQGMASAFISINQLLNANATLLSPSTIMSEQLTTTQWLSAIDNTVIAQCNTGSNPSACAIESSLLPSSLTFTNNTEIKLCQLVWVNASTVPPLPTANSCANTSINPTGMQASVNVLQMLTTIAEIANNQNAIAVSGSLGINGISSMSVSLQLIQPPAVAYGPVGTKASNAQVNATVTIAVPLVGNIVITLTGATGLAQLAQIYCTGNTMTKTNINGSTNTATGSVAIPGLGTNVGVSVNGQSTTQLSFTAGYVPPSPSTSPYNPLQIGTNAPTLGYTNIGILSGLNVLLQGIVSGILNGALSTTLPLVLTPLGVTIGGADVADLSTNCAAVSLVQ